MSIRQRDKSIDPRKAQKWQIVIELGVDDKKRDRSYFSFFGTKAQCEKEEARLTVQAEQGILIDSSRMRVGEYLDYWLGKHKEKLSPKTYECYEQIIRLHIKPALGSLLLQKLKPHHIQDYCDNLSVEGRKDGRSKKNRLGEETKSSGLAATSIVKHHRILHKALSYAVTKDMVMRNAAEGVELPSKEQPEYTILSVEQINQMLDAAKNEKPDYYRILYVTINTGLRRGEILGLREQDIDEINSCFYVLQTVQYTKAEGIFIKDPKTEKSVRKVDIDQDVMDILKEQILEKNKRKAKLEDSNIKYNDLGLIFCQADGNPMHPDTISSWFPNFMKDNGLPRLRFHDLRHNHFSHIIESGVSIAVASERAGHREKSTTMNIYTHAIQTAQREAAEAMGKILKLKQSK